MTTFVDRVTLHVAAGDGGNGCASVHREKFKPLGGPDGGNGGRGGDVILVVDSGESTLLTYHFHPHQQATSGKPGQGSNRSGADGEDLVLSVPEGTVVHRRRRRGARRPRRRRHPGDHRQGWSRRAGQRRAGVDPAAGPGLRAARRAGRGRRRRPRAQERRRRRAGRLPERGQVVADLRGQRGEAEGRRLSVHHARPQPRGRAVRRPAAVHHRRRARPDPRCEQRARAWVSSSSGTSSAAR